MTDSTDGLRPESIDAATAILDVRRHAGKHQIRGALQYDVKRLLEAEPLTLPLSHDAPVAVYGDSQAEVDAVVQKLQQSGYAGAAALEGGIEGWKDAGRPLEDQTQEQPIPGEPGAGIPRL